MQKDINKYKNKYRAYFLGTVLGLIVTFLFVLIFAAVLLIFGLNKEFADPFATVSLACGSFSSAYFIAYKIGSRGYLIGLCAGIIIFLITTLIGLAINAGAVTLNTLFHLIIITLSGVLGGILAVNKEKENKYIV